MQTQPDIFIFTALPCEAKPLVDRFGLKKHLNIDPFAIYSHGDYCLTVSGLGKSAMAAAVAYTLALFANANNPVLINIGIAGHQSYQLGEHFIADKITDLDSKRNFYPPLIYNPTCHTASVITVSIPQNHYRQDCLFDMEASAFYETALKFTSAELVQCLKVISDNESSPTKNIQPKLVSQWIEENIEFAEILIKELTLLAKIIEPPEPEYFDEITDQWRFTVSEQHKLKQLLLRHQALTGNQLPEINKSEYSSAKILLRWLEMNLEKASLSMRL